VDSVFFCFQNNTSKAGAQEFAIILKAFFVFFTIILMAILFCRAA